MKKGSEFYIFVVICIMTLTFYGCVIIRPPSVSTSEVTDIRPAGATAGGEVTSDGNADIIVRGVCWSTGKKPNIEDDRTTDGYGVGVFISSITDLEPSTLYYLRAYAINSEGTSYGSQVKIDHQPVWNSRADNQIRDRDHPDHCRFRRGNY